MTKMSVVCIAGATIKISLGLLIIVSSKVLKYYFLNLGF